jgi:hypothetical protein
LHRCVPFMRLGLKLLILEGVRYASSAKAVAVLFLATPLLAYARIGQEENLLALAYGALLLSVSQLFAGNRTSWLLLGAAAAFAILTRLASLPSATVLLLAVLPCLRRDIRVRRFWLWMGPAALLLLLALSVYAYWNWVRFGSPLESGYRFGFARMGVPMFAFGGFPEHVVALLVSPGRGILVYAPILLALPAARSYWRAMTPSLRRLCTVAWTAPIVNLLFFGLLGTWHGGFGWGPRFLVAPLVFLVPVFSGIPWTRFCVRLLVMVSILVQCGSVVLPTSTEDFVASSRRERGLQCDVWTLGCSGIWLRPALAFRALENTVAGRPLPTLEEGAPASAAEALQTSDFRAAYWWPVRIAYRLHRDGPLAGLAASLAGILVALWFLRRALSGPGPRPASPPTTLPAHA